MRATVQGRRLSEGAALALGFSGIGVVLGSYGAGAGVRRYVAGGYPAELPVTLAVLAWIVAVAWPQIKTTGDRPWNRFLATMPVGPLDRMLIVLRSGILPAVGGLCVLFGVLVGARVEIASLAALVRWPTVIMAFLWVLSLGTMLAVALAPGSPARRIVLVLLSLWWLCLVLRIGLQSAGDRRFTALLSQVLTADPALTIIGVTGLVRALTAPPGALLAAAAVSFAHLAVISLLSAVLASYIAGRTRSQADHVSLPLTLSKRVGDWAFRHLPGELGAQFALEWLRVLRSANSLALIYVLLPFGIAAVDSRRMGGGNVAVFAIVFCATGFAVDVAAGFLDHQPGRRLYELYAVDARHYAVSFIAAFALTGSLIYVAQLPALGLADGRFVTTMFCYYAATVVILTDLGVALVRRARELSLITRILAGGLCAAVSLMILGLSFYSRFVTLLLACAWLASKFRTISRAEVRRYYWGLP